MDLRSANLSWIFPRNLFQEHCVYTKLSVYTLWWNCLSIFTVLIWLRRTTFTLYFQHYKSDGRELYASGITHHSFIVAYLSILHSCCWYCDPATNLDRGFFILLSHSKSSHSQLVFPDGFNACLNFFRVPYDNSTVFSKAYDERITVVTIQ